MIKWQLQTFYICMNSLLKSTRVTSSNQEGTEYKELKKRGKKLFFFSQSSDLRVMINWTLVWLSSRKDVTPRQHLPRQPQCTHLLGVFSSLPTVWSQLLRCASVFVFFFAICELNKHKEEWWNHQLATCSLQWEENTKELSLPSSFVRRSLIVAAGVLQVGQTASCFIHPVRAVELPPATVTRLQLYIEFEQSCTSVFWPWNESAAQASTFRFVF